jgi:hypothetical protein
MFETSPNLSSQSTSFNVSSNVLFHFTSSLGNLVNILANDFSPRYCPEYDLARNPNDETLGPLYAKPMVSFCDLPLSLIKEHLRGYGDYGIGLKKNWGLQNRLTPVLYVHERSSVLDIVDSLLMSPHNAAVSTQFTYDQLFSLLAHVKPYEGGEWRTNREPPYRDNVRFYDEREWRFVPKLSIMDDKSRLVREEYMDGQLRNEAAKKLAGPFQLKFKPDDIHYIIVSKENEILEMVEKLKDIKRFFEPNVITLLTTKILSAERIWEDF